MVCPSLGARVCLELEVGPDPCCELGGLPWASIPALQAAAGVVYSAYLGTMISPAYATR